MIIFYLNSPLVVQTVKCLPTMWETRVQSLGQGDLLEKGMATHSSILVTTLQPPHLPQRRTVQKRSSRPR